MRLFGSKQKLKNGCDPRRGIRGFTIMEVVVYVALLAMIMTSVSTLLLWAIQAHTKIKVMRETFDNARRALEIMVLEIREAASIYTPTMTLNQLSLETSKYAPPGESLSYIDFFRCGDRVCMKKEAQNPIALTSNNVIVSKLEFRRVATSIEKPSAQITLKVEYKNPENIPERQSSIELTTSASLRSY